MVCRNKEDQGHCYSVYLCASISEFICISLLEKVHPGTPQK